MKYIRDQADALALQFNDQNVHKPKASVNAAQVAASALRRILTRERGSTSLDISTTSSAPIGVNPLDGWDDGIILRKSHFCLLLKPQIILRTEPSAAVREGSTVVLAAVQSKLQSFKIMDASNLEDPISGIIMTRYESKRSNQLLLTLLSEITQNWMVSKPSAPPIRIHMRTERCPWKF